MSEKKLKTLSDLGVHLHDDHKIPVSRREFLASGIIGLSTFALVPSLMMQSPSALAQIVSDKISLGIPFLGFEGVGGMNIAGGNVMVGFEPDEEQKNYGPLNYSDYILLGLPPALHPSKSGMLNEDYGLVFHSTSGILAGMNLELAMNPELKDSIDGIIICGRTGDDTAENPINVAFQAQRSGAKGKLVQLIGDSGTPTGARSPAVATQIKSELNASRIKNFADGSSLLSIGQDAINNTFLDIANKDGKGTSRIQSLLASITGLSKARLDKFVNRELEVQSILKAENASKDVFKKFSPTALNPTTNPDTASLGKLQAAFGGTGTVVMDERIASIANLVTDRIAGVGSITIGGCDYHTGNASNGIAKDTEIGKYIGKCIKLAALKEQNLFIHLYTDGGVGGDNAGTTDDTIAGAGRVNWAGDNGTTSSQLCIVYKHGHKRSLSGPLLLAGKTRQVGYFKHGGGNNLTATSVSNNIDQMWKAVILNYLACMSTAQPDGVIADVKKKFLELFPSETIPTDVDKLIRFKSIIS
jgi:hypothetical protein